MEISERALGDEWFAMFVRWQRSHSPGASNPRGPHLNCQAPLIWPVLTGLSSCVVIFWQDAGHFRESGAPPFILRGKIYIRCWSPEQLFSMKRRKWSDFLVSEMHIPFVFFFPSTRVYIQASGHAKQFLYHWVTSLPREISLKQRIQSHSAMGQLPFFRWGGRSSWDHMWHSLRFEPPASPVPGYGLQLTVFFLKDSTLPKPYCLLSPDPCKLASWSVSKAAPCMWPGIMVFQLWGGARTVGSLHVLH